MKTKLLGLIVMSALAAGGAAVLGVGCGNPIFVCPVGSGGHAVRYYTTASTPTTGPCSPAGSPWLYEDTVGFQQYLGPAPNSSPGCAPNEICYEDGGGSSKYNGVPIYHPDYAHPTITVQPGILGAIQGDAVNANYSVVPFPYTPDKNNLCLVATVPPTEQNGTLQGNPTDLVYAWTNLSVIGTTAIPGTQWTATLNYTDKTNNCTATLNAVGIYPSVGCQGANGNPDNRICNPQYNYNASVGLPDGGHQGGQVIAASGINPNFPVYCDPKTFTCELVETTPGTAPAIPDYTSGWDATATWLTDAGGND